MSTDWNSQWLPPGASPPAQETAPQDTGWDWSWLTSGFGARPVSERERPGSEAYHENDPMLNWIRSWGWPNLAPSDETKLAELIAKKEGIETPLGATRSLRDAYLEKTARDAAHRATTDAGYRQQLAQSLGWNLDNPHVRYWLQHGTDVPSDPTSGATASGATTGSKASPQPSAVAGAPFDPKAWGGRAGDPGYTYGAVLPPDIAAAAGVTNQWGVDYAVKEGTPLTAPFAGTVKEAGWNGPYGFTVMLTLTNGYTYRVAHLESIPPGMAVGAKVNVGDVLGPVGNTGNSFGAHVLIEMKDEKGQPIDPTGIINNLLKGDFGGATQMLSDFQSAGSAGPIRTTDGHLLYPGSGDYNVFFATQSLWKKRYGGDPPWSFVSSLIADGNTTAEQIQEVMDGMGSDISGMTWGQRDQFTSDADKVAQSAFGRPLPTSTLKRLAGQGITTSGQLDLWAKSHPASAIGQQDYGAIFDQLSPEVKGLWNEPPSPDMVADIHKRMQQGPQ